MPEEVDIFGDAIDAAKECIEVMCNAKSLIIQQNSEIKGLKTLNAQLIHEAMVADNAVIALQGDYATLKLNHDVDIQLRKGKNEQRTG